VGARQPYVRCKSLPTKETAGILWVDMMKILKLFGIYDLREEGRKWAIREFGEQYGDEFVEKYENINRGIPIGGFVETVVFLDMVERIKRELEKETLIWKIRNILNSRDLSCSETPNR